MTTVLDASFALDWLAATTGREASRVLPDLAQDGLLAPVTFWHEVASGLRRMALRKAVPASFRLTGVRRLSELAIELDEPGRAIESVMEVSDRYQLTIYDAAYLELAVRTSSAIASRDNGLAAAARKAKVKLISTPS